jgi:hypothetical protein
MHSPSRVCRFIAYKTKMFSYANVEKIIVLSTLIYFSLSGNDDKQTDSTTVVRHLFTTGEQTGVPGF